MLNTIFFHVPTRFQKHLLCQEPLVIISDIASHERHGVCSQLRRKTPPQCEDLDRDEKKERKSERERTERTLAFKFVRVSIFHKVRLVFSRSDNFNCQLLERPVKELAVIHGWFQVTGFSISNFHSLNQ